jgi:hypothetical protein
VVLNGGLWQPSEDATPIRTSESILSTLAEAERWERQATFRRMNSSQNRWCLREVRRAPERDHVGGKTLIKMPDLKARLDNLAATTSRPTSRAGASYSRAARGEAELPKILTAIGAPVDDRELPAVRGQGKHVGPAVLINLLCRATSSS